MLKAEAAGVHLWPLSFTPLVDTHVLLDHAGDEQQVIVT